MAIKNIQTLQSNHNIFEQDAKEQYIQALANAGQRIGVKGDSITLDQFNFLDILKENPNFSLSKDKENYLGKMVYSLDSNGVPQGNFSVLSKDNFMFWLYLCCLIIPPTAMSEFVEIAPL